MCFQKWCLLACSMNLSISSLLVSHSVLLNLLPLNYWLEYLDLLFFYKCKSGIIQLNLENYVKYCNSKSRCGSSGLYLRTAYFKTSLFRDSFFIRLSKFGMPFLVISKQKLLCHLLKLSLSLSVLLGYQIFDGDNVRTFKLICPKCRKVNIFSICSC